MKTVFPMIPASNAPILFFLGVADFMVAILALLAWVAFSSRNMKFEISSEGLNITGGMYGRMNPAASLMLEDARPLDLARDRDYQLRWRTNGSGFPGFGAGWFKLRNGEKSLVFVTDKRRICYIPTRDGYSLLLSVAEPEAFREALAQATRSGRGG